MFLSIRVENVLIILFVSRIINMWDSLGIFEFTQTELIFQRRCLKRFSTWMLVALEDVFLLSSVIAVISTVAKAMGHYILLQKIDATIILVY